MSLMLSTYPKLNTNLNFNLFIENALKRTTFWAWFALS